MKRSKLISSVFLTLLVISSAFAQDEDAREVKRKYRLGTSHNFQVDLGTNNWLEDDKFPNDDNALYSVRPWGSWYVALNAINDTHVGGPLHLEWGFGVSWYNFKFENEGVRLTEGVDMIEFTEVPSDVDAKKSKLTASYINASLVPVLQFGNNRHRGHRHGRNWGDWNGFRERGGLRIGAGAYAGYKIESHTKTVIDDRNRDKDHDGFYLNNVRYGLRVQVGFRGVDVFANYDLNEMFVDNKGPKLNAFSFGITI